MSLRLALPLFLLTLGAGYVVGHLWHRATRQAPAPSAARERFPEVEALLRAHEKNDASAFMELYAKMGAAGELPAEARFLEALRHRDTRGLAELAQAERGTSVGARAALAVLRKAMPGHDRSLLQRRFLEAYPESWLAARWRSSESR